MDDERDDRRDDRPAAGGVRRDGRDKPEPDRELKRDIHIADISARLRHVCRHLTDEEFARLVFDMAETKLRFASIDAASWRRPRPSENNGPG